MTASLAVGDADFALIGHQENWGQIAEIVRGMRRPGDTPISMEDIRSIVPWIPPRTVSRVRVGSTQPDREVGGVYIDTFITPDELAAGAIRPLLAKVRAAAAVAEREGAGVAALGGFASIAIEGASHTLGDRVAFTTGNSLTAALIVHGITAAAARVRISLAEATVLIVGGTGDVGSGCARWLAPRVGRLLLAARQQGKLTAEVARLREAGHRAEAVIDLAAAIPNADVILAVASLPAPQIAAAGCRPGALLCDAGYPKNLIAPAPGRGHLFWGGMGRARGGIRSDDGMLERFYRFPIDNIGHGCMLEGLLLALADRHEAFSHGRGHITPARIDEIWHVAGEHGFEVAPFFNQQGLWSKAESSTAAA